MAEKDIVGGVSIHFVLAKELGRPGGDSWAMNGYGRMMGAAFGSPRYNIWSPVVPTTTARSQTIRGFCKEPTLWFRLAVASSGWFSILSTQPTKTTIKLEDSKLKCIYKCTFVVLLLFTFNIFFK